MGSTIVIVAMVLDITKRKRAEVNLLRKNKEFELAKTEIQYQKRALDEHAIVSVIAKDETLISVNGKFTEISKFTENELVGGHFCIGMSDDQPEEFFIELSGTIQRGEPWCGDICNMTKDGHPYWTKTTITPFIDTKGNIYKFVAISTDFTAQKMAEGDLRGKTLEVEQAHKELEASITSHCNQKNSLLWVNWPQALLMKLTLPFNLLVITLASSMRHSETCLA